MQPEIHNIPDNRQHARRSVLWTGNVSTPERTLDCSIWNISLGGAKIRCWHPINKGTKLTLDIARLGRFSAEVVWIDGPEVGVRFINSNHASQQLLERSPIPLH